MLLSWNQSREGEGYDFVQHQWINTTMDRWMIEVISEGYSTELQGSKNGEERQRE